MHSLTRLGLRTKIALPFVITAIALMIVGLFSVSTARNLVADTEDIAATYLPSVSEILNGDRDLYQALVAQMTLVDQAFNNEPTADAKAEFAENADQALRRFQESVERLRGTGISEVTQGFSTAFDQWRASAERVIALAEAGETDQARNLASMETTGLFGALRDYYDRAGAHADEQAQQRSAEASS